MSELADFLLDPVRSGVGLRALAETVPLAALCGALGFWVVSHRASYSAESVAHALRPGLVLAVLAGGSPLVGALPAAALAGVLIALAAREEAIGADTATAIVVTTMLGLGALLALEPDAPARLDELLFGDPLAADGGDIALALGLLGAGVLALAALHRPLAAVAFDPAGSAAAGIRPGLVRAGLLVLLALVVCVAARGLGNLLVLAAIVGPPVAVRRHVHSSRGALLGGGVVGAGACVCGIYASFHLDVAAGAAVALSLCAAAAAGSALPRLAGRPSTR